MGGIGIGRGFLRQSAGLGYDANDLSLKLEGISLGACEHGYCLVHVSCEEWSRVGWLEFLEVGNI